MRPSEVEEGSSTDGYVDELMADERQGDPMNELGGAASAYLAYHKKQRAATIRKAKFLHDKRQEVREQPPPASP
jgi:hypothetical protein